MKKLYKSLSLSLSHTHTHIHTYILPLHLSLTHTNTHRKNENIRRKPFWLCRSISPSQPWSEWVIAPLNSSNSHYFVIEWHRIATGCLYKQQYTSITTQWTPWALVELCFALATCTSTSQAPSRSPSAPPPRRPPPRKHTRRRWLWRCPSFF